MSDEEDKPRRTPFVQPKPPVLQPNIAALLKEKPAHSSSSSSSFSTPSFAPPAAFQPLQNPFTPKPKPVSPLPKPISPIPRISPKQQESKNETHDVEIAKEAKRIEKPRSLETTGLTVSKSSTEIAITPIVEVKEITSPAVVEVSKQLEAVRVEPTPDETLKSSIQSATEPQQQQKPTNMFNDKVDLSGGLMSWITKTVAESKILNDVAEKAKAGMETVMTTLDPGMKPFLAEHGVIELTIFNCDPDILSVASDSFIKAGGLVITRGISDSNADDFPPLVFGDEKAKKMCVQKADLAKKTRKSAEDAAIIVLQPFFINISGRHYAATKILLRRENFECDAISQLVEVSDSIVDVIQQHAKSQNSQEDEFPISVDSAAKKVYTNEIDGTWQAGSAYPPFSSAEFLSAAFISLAQQLLAKK